MSELPTTASNVIVGLAVEGMRPPCGFVAELHSPSATAPDHTAHHGGVIAVVGIPHGLPTEFADSSIPSVQNSANRPSR